MDSVCGQCCQGRIGFGDRILSSYCPCHVDYVRGTADNDIRGYSLDAGGRFLEEFFSAHHATAFDRYSTLREENGRLMKYHSPVDGSGKKSIHLN